MGKKRFRMMWVILSVIVLSALVGVVFVNMPQFGRLPRGERLARIARSAHYRDGEFRNLHETVLMTSGKGFFQNLTGFLFRKQAGLRPDSTLPVIKTDLQTLNLSEDLLVWFGHSSYLIQMEGKRLLVDPVFCTAAPVSFVNKPFKGTEVYRPEDMPDIDYLIITHDHWDHLDYRTVTALKDRVQKVVCPLGVGEHFEYWGFSPERIVELDWEEQALLDDGFRIHCLPARHFSGRGLARNRSLWASFLVTGSRRKVFIGGDGGYDTHFAEIGMRFPDIDWAILENGQYNEGWKYIHLMPGYMAAVARELKAAKILTVHHSKYALAAYPWDEPLKNARRMRDRDSLPVVIPQIGEVVNMTGH